MSARLRIKIGRVRLPHWDFCRNPRQPVTFRLVWRRRWFFFCEAVVLVERGGETFL